MQAKACTLNAFAELEFKQKKRANVKLTEQNEWGDDKEVDVEMRDG